MPSAVIWAIAYIREYGNAKYHNPYNWHSVEPDRYIEALLRHVELYRENPFGYDEESGLPHLWHIACNVAFLCDFYQDIFNGELGIKNGDPLDFEKVSPYFWKDCKEEVTCFEFKTTVDSDLLKKIFLIPDDEKEDKNGLTRLGRGEQLETDEAIEWLYDMKHDIKHDERAEALDMAIEALRKKEVNE